MFKSIVFSLLLVNVLANTVDARSFNVGSNNITQQNSNNTNQYVEQQINDITNRYTDNRVKNGGNTTGTVSINKDVINNYNGQCIQHCVVYIIKEPKIQYIRN